MKRHLVAIIESDDPAVRNLSLASLCEHASAAGLLGECAALELFRKESKNLYHRVRALFFLHAIHRYHLPSKPEIPKPGRIPAEGHGHLLARRFEEAIGIFLDCQRQGGPTAAISSALSQAYHQLGFQTLADQVRKSVRSVRGNQWMFRIGHPLDQPLRLRDELLSSQGPGNEHPVLREETPVRLDLTHSAWSDIFFLGMDHPEAAKVLNISIDLCVHGRDRQPCPPIQTSLRVLDEPLLRLRSVDLDATVEITELAEVFDFARDYLGLLKAGIIASGIVPPGIEGSGESLRELLSRMAGAGRGIELLSHVRGIPKGSRLAVSTNLLASLIAVCMRATGQTRELHGPLSEGERRITAARAILGEWLGGSGGGWQDSGGLWPGMKLIEGQLASDSDPEFGISRGRLLPSHRLLCPETASLDELQESLILVHGGMAQDVGPILEMVTEKYLLRSEPEWQSRSEALGILDDILKALGSGDVPAIAAATTKNFFGPICSIIPWASNLFTETVIDKVRQQYGEDYLGFCMLGGMSGGGMGFVFKPEVKIRARDDLLRIMRATKRELQDGLAFAMEPVVYDFAVNIHGSVGRLLRHPRPEKEPATPLEQQPDQATAGLETLLEAHGFDLDLHEQIRSDLRQGRIGLAQNRLPVHSSIEDVLESDYLDAQQGLPKNDTEAGMQALAEGLLAVVTLAAGAGSRWTKGAGVVKALNPFCRLAGRHRSFLELHLAKTRRRGKPFASLPPHVITTSYLTHAPIQRYLEAKNNFGHAGPLLLSPSRAVGLRMIPMVRDLSFAFEETPQQLLDERAQKLRDSLHAAWIAWAQECGEGSDYRGNLPLQCMHPVGHWFEIPNMLRNGVIEQLLDDRPRLRYLLLHNIDTLGADVDPALLGAHINRGSTLSGEVIPRLVDDRGGGLARVDGRPRLIEGLALPKPEDEFRLSYYNSLSTWIDLDKLLGVMGLERAELGSEAKVIDAIRRLGARIPTYVTHKEVKKRWGHGQEDIFPVSQFEKLWGDMTALPEIDCSYFVVSRLRGQQLKDPAQLDGWVRDGSAAYVETLCAF